MRALVTYGSKRGGTAELAEMLAADLKARRLETDVIPAPCVDSLEGYDVVIVGGALYADRWHRDARRFVRRYRKALRSRLVWLFSSGPLGDAYQSPDIPPVRQVAALARRIGARGHVTFGGRLEADATGLVAHSLAGTMAGDWRDPAAIDGWAAEIVRQMAAPAAVGHAGAGGEPLTTADGGASPAGLYATTQNHRIRGASPYSMYCNQP